ncbi:hypothetical protein DRJ17_05020, partial [Candidatus Woesearchaeota archaeon]
EINALSSLQSDIANRFDQKFGSETFSNGKTLTGFLDEVDALIDLQSNIVNRITQKFDMQTDDNGTPEDTSDDTWYSNITFSNGKTYKDFLADVGALVELEQQIITAYLDFAEEALGKPISGYQISFSDTNKNEVWDEGEEPVIYLVHDEAWQQGEQWSQATSINQDGYISWSREETVYGTVVTGKIYNDSGEYQGKQELFYLGGQLLGYTIESADGLTRTRYDSEGNAELTVRTTEDGSQEFTYWQTEIIEVDFIGAVVVQTGKVYKDGEFQGIQEFYYRAGEDQPYGYTIESADGLSRTYYDADNNPVSTVNELADGSQQMISWMSTEIMNSAELGQYLVQTGRVRINGQDQGVQQFFYKIENNELIPVEAPEVEPQVKSGSEPTGVWGWMCRNIGRPVKNHWQGIVGAVEIVVGVVLCVTGVGAPIGAAMILNGLWMIAGEIQKSMPDSGWANNKFARLLLYGDPNNPQLWETALMAIPIPGVGKLAHIVLKPVLSAAARVAIKPLIAVGAKAVVGLVKVAVPAIAKAVAKPILSGITKVAVKPVASLGSKLIASVIKPAVSTIAKVTVNPVTRFSSNVISKYITPVASKIAVSRPITMLSSISTRVTSTQLPKTALSLGWKGTVGAVNFSLRKGLPVLTVGPMGTAALMDAKNIEFDLEGNGPWALWQAIGAAQWASVAEWFHTTFTHNQEKAGYYNFMRQVASQQQAEIFANWRGAVDVPVLSQILQIGIGGLEALTGFAQFPASYLHHIANYGVVRGTLAMSVAVLGYFASVADMLLHTFESLPQGTVNADEGIFYQGWFMDHTVRKVFGESAWQYLNPEGYSVLPNKEYRGLWEFLPNAALLLVPHIEAGRARAEQRAKQQSGPVNPIDSTMRFETRGRLEQVVAGVNSVLLAPVHLFTALINQPLKILEALGYKTKGLSFREGLKDAFSAARLIQDFVPIVGREMADEYAKEIYRLLQGTTEIRKAYEILGLDSNRTYTDKEVRDAYTRLARQYHPDKGGSVEKMVEINKVFELIKTAEVRQMYNSGLGINRLNIRQTLDDAKNRITDFFVNLFRFGKKQSAAGVVLYNSANGSRTNTATVDNRGTENLNIKIENAGTEVARINNEAREAQVAIRQQVGDVSRTQPKEIIVIPDIHAQEAKLEQILVDAGVVTIEEGRWVVTPSLLSGEKIVVMLGDLIHGERAYPGEEPQIALLRKVMALEKDANGNLIVIKGNHEEAELKRVELKRTAISKRAGGINIHQGIAPEGEYRLAGDIKTWISGLPESYQIDGLEFAHAGPFAEDRLWDRGWFNNEEGVRRVFAERGINFGVYGHTPGVELGMVGNRDQIRLAVGNQAAVLDINRFVTGYGKFILESNQWIFKEVILGQGERSLTRINARNSLPSRAGNKAEAVEVQPEVPQSSVVDNNSLNIEPVAVPEVLDNSEAVNPQEANIGSVGIRAPPVSSVENSPAAESSLQPSLFDNDLDFSATLPRFDYQQPIASSEVSESSNLNGVPQTILDGINTLINNPETAISLFITSTLESFLRQQGVSAEEIVKLTPQQAWAKAAEIVKGAQGVAEPKAETSAAQTEPSQLTLPLFVGTSKAVDFEANPSAAGLVSRALSYERYLANQFYGNSDTSVIEPGILAKDLNINWQQRIASNPRLSRLTDLIRDTLGKRHYNPGQIAVVYDLVGEHKLSQEVLGHRLSGGKTEAYLIAILFSAQEKGKGIYEVIVPREHNITSVLQQKAAGLMLENPDILVRVLTSPEEGLKIDAQGQKLYNPLKDVGSGATAEILSSQALSQNPKIEIHFLDYKAALHRASEVTHERGGKEDIEAITNATVDDPTAMYPQPALELAESHYYESMVEKDASMAAALHRATEAMEGIYRRLEEAYKNGSIKLINPVDPELNKPNPGFYLVDKDNSSQFVIGKIAEEFLGNSDLTVVREHLEKKLNLQGEDLFKALTNAWAQAAYGLKAGREYTNLFYELARPGTDVEAVKESFKGIPYNMNDLQGEREEGTFNGDRLISAILAVKTVLEAREKGIEVSAEQAAEGFINSIFHETLESTSYADVFGKGKGAISLKKTTLFSGTTERDLPAYKVQKYPVSLITKEPLLELGKDLDIVVVNTAEDPLALVKAVERLSRQTNADHVFITSKDAENLDLVSNQLDSKVVGSVRGADRQQALSQMEELAASVGAGKSGIRTIQKEITGSNFAAQTLQNQGQTAKIFETNLFGLTELTQRGGRIDKTNRLPAPEGETPVTLVVDIATDGGLTIQQREWLKILTPEQQRTAIFDILMQLDVWEALRSTENATRSMTKNVKIRAAVRPNQEAVAELINRFKEASERNASAPLKVEQPRVTAETPATVEGLINKFSLSQEAEGFLRNPEYGLSTGENLTTLGKFMAEKVLALTRIEGVRSALLKMGLLPQAEVVSPIEVDLQAALATQEAFGIVRAAVEAGMYINNAVDLVVNIAKLIEADTQGIINTPALAELKDLQLQMRQDPLVALPGFILNKINPDSSETREALEAVINPINKAKDKAESIENKIKGFFYSHPSLVTSYMNVEKRLKNADSYNSPEQLNSVPALNNLVNNPSLQRLQESTYSIWKKIKAVAPELFNPKVILHLPQIAYYGLKVYSAQKAGEKAQINAAGTAELGRLAGFERPFEFSRVFGLSDGAIEIYNKLSDQREINALKVEPAILNKVGLFELESLAGDQSELHNKLFEFLKYKANLSAEAFRLILTIESILEVVRYVAMLGLIKQLGGKEQAKGFDQLIENIQDNINYISENLPDWADNPKSYIGMQEITDIATAFEVEEDVVYSLVLGLTNNAQTMARINTNYNYWQPRLELMRRAGEQISDSTFDVRNLASFDMRGSSTGLKDTYHRAVAELIVRDLLPQELELFVNGQTTEAIDTKIASALDVGLNNNLYEQISVTDIKAIVTGIKAAQERYETKINAAIEGIQDEIESKQQRLAAIKNPSVDSRNDYNRLTELSEDYLEREELKSGIAKLEKALTYAEEIADDQDLTLAEKLGYINLTASDDVLVPYSAVIRATRSTVGTSEFANILEYELTQPSSKTGVTEVLVIPVSLKEIVLSVRESIMANIEADQDVELLIDRALVRAMSRIAGEGLASRIQGLFAQIDWDIEVTYANSSEEAVSVDVFAEMIANGHAENIIKADLVIPVDQKSKDLIGEVAANLVLATAGDRIDASGFVPIEQAISVKVQGQEGNNQAANKYIRVRLYGPKNPQVNLPTNDMNQVLSIITLIQNGIGAIWGARGGPSGTFSASATQAQVASLLLVEIFRALNEVIRETKEINPTVPTESQTNPNQINQKTKVILENCLVIALASKYPELDLTSPERNKERWAEVIAIAINGNTEERDGKTAFILTETLLEAINDIVTNLGHYQPLQLFSGKDENGNACYVLAESENDENRIVITENALLYHAQLKAQQVVTSLVPVDWAVAPLLMVAGLPGIVKAEESLSAAVKEEQIARVTRSAREVMGAIERSSESSQFNIKGIIKYLRGIKYSVLENHNHLASIDLRQLPIEVTFDLGNLIRLSENAIKVVLAHESAEVFYRTWWAAVNHLRHNLNLINEEEYITLSKTRHNIVDLLGMIWAKEAGCDVYAGRKGATSLNEIRYTAQGNRKPKDTVEFTENEAEIIIQALSRNNEAALEELRALLAQKTTAFKAQLLQVITTRSELKKFAWLDQPWVNLYEVVMPAPLSKLKVPINKRLARLFGVKLENAGTDTGIATISDVDLSPVNYGTENYTVNYTEEEGLNVSVANSGEVTRSSTDAVAVDFSWVEANASDQKPIWIALDKKNIAEGIIKLGRQVGLKVIFAGGTARRMLWGQNPITNFADKETDVDIMIQIIGNKPVTASELKSMVDAFGAKIKENYLGLVIDIMNYDENSMKGYLHEGYALFNEKSQAATINQTLITIEEGGWVVWDEKGGAYIQDARNNILRLAPRSGTNGELLISSVLAFVRLMAEFPQKQIDADSLAQIRGFVENWDYESDSAYRINTSLPDQRFLKIYKYAQKPSEVNNLLKQVGRESKNLFTIYSKVLDLERIASVAAQWKGGSDFRVAVISGLSLQEDQPIQANMVTVNQDDSLTAEVLFTCENQGTESQECADEEESGVKDEEAESEGNKDNKNKSITKNKPENIEALEKIGLSGSLDGKIITINGKSRKLYLWLAERGIFHSKELEELEGELDRFWGLVKRDDRSYNLEWVEQYIVEQAKKIGEDDSEIRRRISSIEKKAEEAVRNKAGMAALKIKHPRVYKAKIKRWKKFYLIGSKPSDKKLVSEESLLIWAKKVELYGYLNLGDLLMPVNEDGNIIRELIEWIPMGQVAPAEYHSAKKVPLYQLVSVLANTQIKLFTYLGIVLPAALALGTVLPFSATVLGAAKNQGIAEAIVLISEQVERLEEVYFEIGANEYEDILLLYVQPGVLVNQGGAAVIRLADGRVAVAVEKDKAYLLRHELAEYAYFKDNHISKADQKVAGWAHNFALSVQDQVIIPDRYTGEFEQTALPVTVMSIKEDGVASEDITDKERLIQLARIAAFELPNTMEFAKRPANSRTLSINLSKSFYSGVLSFKTDVDNNKFGIISAAQTAAVVYLGEGKEEVVLIAGGIWGCSSVALIGEKDKEVVIALAHNMPYEVKQVKVADVKGTTIKEALFLPQTRAAIKELRAEGVVNLRAFVHGYSVALYMQERNITLKVLEQDLGIPVEGFDSKDGYRNGYDIENLPPTMVVANRKGVAVFYPGIRHSEKVRVHLWRAERSGEEKDQREEDSKKEKDSSQGKGEKQNKATQEKAAKPALPEDKKENAGLSTNLTSAIKNKLLLSKIFNRTIHYVSGLKVDLKYKLQAAFAAASRIVLLLPDILGPPLAAFRQFIKFLIAYLVPLKTGPPQELSIKSTNNFNPFFITVLINKFNNKPSLPTINNLLNRGRLVKVVVAAFVSVSLGIAYMSVSPSVAGGGEALFQAAGAINYTPQNVLISTVAGVLGLAAIVVFRGHRALGLPKIDPSVASDTTNKIRRLTDRIYRLLTQLQFLLTVAGMGVAAIVVSRARRAPGLPGNDPSAASDTTIGFIYFSNFEEEVVQPQSLGTKNSSAALDAAGGNTNAVEVIEQHNWAYLSWWKGYLAGRIAFGSILINIDYHADLFPGWFRLTPKDGSAWAKLKDAEKLALIKEYAGKIDCARYVGPAVYDGLFDEIYWVVPGWVRDSKGRGYVDYSSGHGRYYLARVSAVNREDPEDTISLFYFGPGKQLLLEGSEYHLGDKTYLISALQENQIRQIAIHAVTPEELPDFKDEKCARVLTWDVDSVPGAGSYEFIKDTIEILRQRSVNPADISIAQSLGINPEGSIPQEKIAEITKSLVSNLASAASQRGSVNGLGSIVAGVVSLVAGFAAWKLIPAAILANISGAGLGLIGLFFIAQAMAIIHTFIKQGGIRGSPWATSIAQAERNQIRQHPAFKYLPKLSQVSILRHEQAHLEGKGEIRAYLTQALYLVHDIVKSIMFKPQSPIVPARRTAGSNRGGSALRHAGVAGREVLEIAQKGLGFEGVRGLLNRLGALSVMLKGGVVRWVRLISKI